MCIYIKRIDSSPCHGSLHKKYKNKIQGSVAKTTTQEYIVVFVYGSGHVKKKKKDSKM